jgi:hypothetical protein
MFQRIIRRSNFIINNTPFSFSPKMKTNITSHYDISVIDRSKTSLKNYLKNVVIEGDPHWKIRKLVDKELEKEGIQEPKGGIFSGLVGILFFIVFLYERRII